MTRPPLRAAGPDRRSALAQYRVRAAVYDWELAPFEPIRRRAHALLAAGRGETVLDLACGTGLSLPALAAAVGRRGRVVGVEQCHEMIEQARRRCRALPQVRLVEAPVEQAELAARADAALLHFTHDVLQSPPAVRRVFEHLKPGARVVACGLCWAPPWALAVNCFVLPAALYSVTSLAGLDRPWQPLAERLVDWRVERWWGGGVYVAAGRVPGGATVPADG